MARGSPCRTHADLEPIVERINLVRIMMRKEADLECDATARTFEVVLEKVLTGVELIARRNHLLNFRKRFGTRTSENQRACRYD